MTLSPPYVSQWGDLRCNRAVIESGLDPAEIYDWASAGFVSAHEYRLWSRNTCGLACLESVLRVRGIEVPLKGDLIKSALAYGALTLGDDGTIGGLYYEPFVNWVAHDFGLEAVSRPELRAAEIAEAVASGDWFAISSVSSEIRWLDRAPTRRGGHLVLVHGVEDSNLIFHNPSGLDGTAENAHCDVALFDRFFAGRGILVRRWQ